MKKREEKDIVINWDYDEDNEILIEGLKYEYYKEGMKIGIKKGKKKVSTEAAKKLLKYNLSIDTIAEVTNLSKAQIQKLI